MHPKAKLDSVAEEDAVSVTIIQKPAHNKRLIPKPVQHIVAKLNNRMKEPEPEIWTNTPGQSDVKSQIRILGWLPVLISTSALGIFLVAFGCVSSIHTSADQEIYLWLGLLLIFAPSFFRLLSPTASRAERIAIVCIAGFCIYLVPMILSPLHFIFVDEYLHWRTVDDIVRSGHLFSESSILPVSPLFPGLEIVTDAFSSLSGLNTYTSGLIVIAIVRIVTVLSLFMLFEQITTSARVAGIATILYMANSGFFLFDSLFLYESLGIAIGVFLMFTLVRLETVENHKRGLLLIALIAIGALTITHHVSDFFFVGLLVLWIIIRKFLGQPILRSSVAIAALFGIFLSIIWIVFVARPVVEYLYAPIRDSLVQLLNLFTSFGKARHLFTDYTGAHPTPLWQQLAMLCSVGLTSLGIPFAFICIWHRYRHNALTFMLGIVSLLYPFLQALRFTGESANIADRSSPYIFLAISFTLSILITQMWPIRALKWRQTLLITFVASLIFLGGTLLGTGPAWKLMPGAYAVGDDARSISPEGIQAARWTLAHLGPNNRISTDSINSLLMSTYGDQRIVTTPFDGVEVAPVFYASQFHTWEVSILQSAHVHYLVVDLRLSTSLPTKGYYFDSEEPEAANLTTPISRQALTKFDTVPQINRLFDSGNIVIYDVGELTNAP